MGVRTYDPRDVQVIVGGVPMSGYADGTFVSLAQENDSYSKTIGADGEVSRARSNDRTGTLTLTLKQTSPSNDVLSGFMLLDDVSNGGVVPVLIREAGSGRTLVFAQTGWIQKPPDIVYSKEIEGREWMIALGDVKRFIGGNASNSGG